MKPLDPIFLHRDGFFVGRVAGAALSREQVLDERDRTVLRAVRAGHQSKNAIAAAVKGKKQQVLDRIDDLETRGHLRNGSPNGSLSRPQYVVTTEGAKSWRRPNEGLRTVPGIGSRLKHGNRGTDAPRPSPTDVSLRRGGVDRRRLGSCSSSSVPRFGNRWREHMSAEAALAVKSWKCGPHTVTLTMRRPKPGTAASCVIEWGPFRPSSLSDGEVIEYRAGRDIALAEVAAELGINVAVVTL